jgi:hypothetical protein
VAGSMRVARMPVALITVVPAKTTSSRSWTPWLWRGR